MWMQIPQMSFKRSLLMQYGVLFTLVCLLWGVFSYEAMAQVTFQMTPQTYVTRTTQVTLSPQDLNTLVVFEEQYFGQTLVNLPVDQRVQLYQQYNNGGNYSRSRYRRYNRYYSPQRQPVPFNQYYQEQVQAYRNQNAATRPPARSLSDLFH